MAFRKSIGVFIEPQLQHVFYTHAKQKFESKFFRYWQNQESTLRLKKNLTKTKILTSVFCPFSKTFNEGHTKWLFRPLKKFTRKSRNSQNDTIWIREMRMNCTQAFHCFFNFSPWICQKIYSLDENWKMNEKWEKQTLPKFETMMKKEKNLMPPRSQTFPWNNMETMGCNSEIKIHFVLLQLSSIFSWIKYYVYFIMECLFVVVTVLWKSIVLSWHAWWGSIYFD